MSVILDILFAALLFSFITNVFFAFYFIWKEKYILLWISSSAILTLLVMGAGIIFGLGYTPDWYRISFYLAGCACLYSLPVFYLSKSWEVEAKCMILWITCSVYVAVAPVAKLEYDIHVTEERNHDH